MIACHQHDYVEIACMHKFPVKLLLKNGMEIEGIANDTTINNNREECIILKTGDKEQIVVLDKIKEMDVQIENPHFTLVKFD